ncbi:MAG: hypothetical protein EOM37_04225 [Proteobacteria bacterium]|nr:hypothetical protein [Alphaproteobacteria bacterium]NCC03240.1 hypothetical protein [Pseudomonadota bacterium]
MIQRTLIQIGLLFFPLVLGACANKEQAVLPDVCPHAAILRPLERVEDYGGDTHDVANLVAVAVMDSVVIEKCDVEDEAYDLNLLIRMRAEKGPRLGGNKLSLPYVVSLVGEDDRVDHREISTASITFDGKSKLMPHEEKLHLVIPRVKDEKAPSQYILLGFQLSESQLKE